jgi:hypothetical protein
MIDREGHTRPFHGVAVQGWNNGRLNIHSNTYYLIALFHEQNGSHVVDRIW